MDENERKAFAEAVATAAATAVTEALKPAEPTKDENGFETVAEAMIEAGLSKESRAAVYERLTRGESVTDAIAKEKAREDAIEARVAEKLAAKPAPVAEGFGYTVDATEGRQAVESVDAEYNALLED